MNQEPRHPHPDESAHGLIGTFNLDAQGDSDAPRLYNYPQISDMTKEAIRLAQEPSMNLPRAIKKVAFRHAAEAEMLNQTADGNPLDVSDREVCDQIEDITQMFQQLITYEMLHAERDHYRKRQRADEARLRIRDFLRDERIREPLFHDIDRTMKTRYQSLPYEEADRIARAIERFQGGDFDDDDTSVMADYYDRVRRELSAKELGIEDVSVPSVERTGSMADSMSPDISKLGDMSPRDQARFISRMLKKY